MSASQHAPADTTSPPTRRGDDPVGRERRTEELLAEAAATSDELARRRLLDEVIMLNSCVAQAIGGRYRFRGIDIDDLNQVAYLGLVKAVHGYRVGAGPGFLAYAVPTISGEIKRHFRDQGWLVRPPRRVQELRTVLAGAESDLIQQIGRSPEETELADFLGVGLADLREARCADSCYSALSIDAPSRAEGQCLGDVIADDVDDFASVDTLATLRPALAALNERERHILLLRFVRGWTQDEIGKDLGVSQMQVSRLLSAILGRLRGSLAEEVA